jgi:GDP-L-fucose synthase
LTGSGVVVSEAAHPLRMKEIWSGADAMVFLMDRYDGGEPINCGTGSEVSIRQLAEMIGRIAGFEGKLVFDIEKPDGTPRKLMDSSRLTALGWRPKTSLEEGVNKVYRWFARTQGSGPATP